MIYGYIFGLVLFALGFFLLFFVAPYAEGEGMMTFAQVLLWGSVGLGVILRLYDRR